MKRAAVALKILLASAFGWHIGVPVWFYLLQKSGVLALIGLLPEEVEVSFVAVGVHRISDVRALVCLSLIPITSVLFFRWVLQGGQELFGRFLGNLLASVLLTPFIWLAADLVLVYVVNAIGQEANLDFQWDSGWLPGWVLAYSFNALCLVVYCFVAKTPTEPQAVDSSWRDR